MATRRPENPLSIGDALSNQDFANEQRGLLDLIDKLRYAQLDNVKLPQIVVVGDQSAGKSSVLEAITGTPFQREAGACTRFATEIRLIRAEEERFSISIIPDKKTRSLAEQERLRQWGNTVHESLGFESLMRRAVELIAPKNVPGRFAAEDILVVEKRGPNLPLLTVVDLPGLVRNVNTHQSADDIRAIEGLTDKYMKSSRTIILAVVGGNHDYAQAPILTKAREFDPTGARTIGVLTKPDLTHTIGLEDEFIALVNNEDKHNHFDLGWYVLLNPGPREPGQEWPSQEDRRRAEEAFFATGKWSELPRSMCGAAALKQKLSAQLQAHIGRHVRTLQKEIQKEHDKCVAELDLLGLGRDTVEEMRDELGQLCSDSRDLVKSAVQGLYSNPADKLFFPRSVSRKGIPPQNLRARAVEENIKFADRVRTRGRKFHFAPEGDAQPGKARKGGIMTKREFAKQEVEPLLQQNVGTELPSDYNPRLVYTLFQDYSENWYRLAQDHKDNLGRICSEFMAEMIDHLWPHRMHENLRKEFLETEVKAILGRAQKELEVLRQDLHFEIQPYDAEYDQRIRNWRESYSKESPYTVAEEVLEKMLIFYDLSAKTFISNVITQVIERHLLQGLLTIFSWTKLGRMNDAKIIAIAAENKATRDRRIALKAKKKDIEDARDACANLAMRKELRTYDQASDSEDESSDEAELPSNRQSAERQRLSSKPSRTDGASLTTPRKSQRPSSYEEQSQTTPSRSEPAHQTNPFASTYNARTPAEPYLETSNGQPISPSSWHNQPPADYYTPTTEEPRVAPPPPPRPEKTPYDNTRNYPTPPNEPINGNQFTSQDQYHGQSPRVDANAGRTPNSYSEWDLSRANNAIDNMGAQSAKRQQVPRKTFFGTAKA